MSDETRTPGDRVVRRGFFAAAAAVAVMFGKVTEQAVLAGTDGDVVLGATNSTSTETLVTKTTDSGTGLDVAAFKATALSGSYQATAGLWGEGRHCGVYG